MSHRIIRQRSFETVRYYRMEFLRGDGDGGFSFDCDAKGKVDVSKLQDLAKANYAACLAGTAGVGEGKVITYEREVRIPTLIRCECGETMALHSGWANACECGCEYNGSGQLLAPRCQWGEETGESFA